MNHSIKNHKTGEVIVKGDFTSVVKLAEDAVRRGISLAYANLADADLSHANLRHAELSDARMSNARLYCASLAHAHMTDADLSGACMDSADLSHACLLGANMRNAGLMYARLDHASLNGAEMQYALLASASLVHANLHEAVLTYVEMGGVSLSGSCVDEADLKDIRSSVCELFSLIPGDLPMIREALAQNRIRSAWYDLDEGLCLLIRSDGSDRKVNVKVTLNADDSAAPEWLSGLDNIDVSGRNQIAEITMGWIDSILSRDDQNTISSTTQMSCAGVSD